MNDLKLAACEVALFCLGIPRRALQHVEGRILRARRKLIGPWSIALAVVACVGLGGCVPGGGPGAVVGAIGAVALVALAVFMAFAGQLQHPEDRSPPRLVALSFVVLAALTVYGCHGAERATRTALDVTAHAVAAADTVVAREYADAAREQLAAATDLDDYHARMRRWDRAESALRAIVQALYAAEAALDASGAANARGVLACVYTAAVDLLGALSALDVPIPQALTRAVDTLGAFVGECHPPQAASPAGGAP